MTTTVNVGHDIALSIVYLDQNGNPMQTTQTPDSTPSWSNTASSVETLTVAANGLTADTAALAVGSDTVNLTVVVGGKTFTASLSVNVTPAPQVLTSIQIAAVVS
jgi:hypothetical protein